MPPDRSNRELKRLAGSEDMTMSALLSSQPLPKLRHRSPTLRHGGAFCSGPAKANLNAEVARDNGGREDISNEQGLFTLMGEHLEDKVYLNTFGEVTFYRQNPSKYNAMQYTIT